MAKGAIAKQYVGQKLQEVFGKDYVGEGAGKHYVWADDGGERVQICLSLTCPKTPLGETAVVPSFDGGIDFDAPQVVVPTKFEPAEISQEEKDTIQDLFERLGL